MLAKCWTGTHRLEAILLRHAWLLAAWQVNALYNLYVRNETVYFSLVESDLSMLLIVV